MFLTNLNTLKTLSKTPQPSRQCPQKIFSYKDRKKNLIRSSLPPAHTTVVPNNLDTPSSPKGFSSLPICKSSPEQDSAPLLFNSVQHRGKPCASPPPFHIFLSLLFQFYPSFSVFSSLFEYLSKKAKRLLALADCNSPVTFMCNLFFHSILLWRILLTSHN